MALLTSFAAAFRFRILSTREVKNGAFFNGLLGPWGCV